MSPDYGRLMPWILAGLAGMIGLGLLFVAWPASFLDWASHMARVRILDDMLQGPSAWTKYYEAGTFFLPNVVLDLVVLGLARLGLSVDLAGSMFLILLYVVFVGGFMRLAMAFRAGGPVKALLAVFLFFNGPLYYGLVNFTFGVGLSMLLAGQWVVSGLFMRIVIVVLGTMAIFECHVVAAFVFVGILGTLDLVAVWQTRGRSLFASTSVAALVIAVALLRLSPTGQDKLGVSWEDRGDAVKLVLGKVALFGKVLMGGARASDVIIVVGLPLLAVAVLVGARVRWSLPAAAVVVTTAALALVSPSHIDAGSLLDYRIALVPWLFAAAGLTMTVRTPGVARFVPIIAFTLVVAKLAALGLAWRSSSDDLARARSEFAKLSPGSVLLTGRARPWSEVPWSMYWDFTYHNADVEAVRYGVFVPAVYAMATQQPLILRPEFRGFMFHLDVSNPDLQAGVRDRPDVRRLCAETPAGVSLLLQFPPEAGVAGARWISRHFQLMDLCRPGPPSPRNS